MAARAFALSPPSSALPPKGNTRRYTKIYFGENQLLPSSISFSLLTTAHPKILHGQPVRSSPLLSEGFNLAMVSSPWLRVFTLQYPLAGMRPIQTWFPYAFASETLRLTDELNSLARSTKSTPSPRLRGAPSLCKRDGFRIYFTGVTPLLLTFPSRYLFTIGDWVVFSFGCIVQPNSLRTFVSRGTQE